MLSLPQINNTSHAPGESVVIATKYYFCSHCNWAHSSLNLSHCKVGGSLCNYSQTCKPSKLSPLKPGNRLSLFLCPLIINISLSLCFPASGLWVKTFLQPNSGCDQHTCRFDYWWALHGPGHDQNRCWGCRWTPCLHEVHLSLRCARKRCNQHSHRSGSGDRPGCPTQPSQVKAIISSQCVLDRRGLVLCCPR